MTAPLKAVDLIKRAPLTDIPERLHIFANELDKDVRAVIVMTIPSCEMYNFGEVLSRAEAAGYLLSAANWHALHADET